MRGRWWIASGGSDELVAGKSGVAATALRDLPPQSKMRRLQAWRWDGLCEGSTKTTIEDEEEHEDEEDGKPGHSESNPVKVWAALVAAAGGDQPSSRLIKAHQGLSRLIKAYQG
jgi:hypothetical protein